GAAWSSPRRTATPRGAHAGARPRPWTCPRLTARTGPSGAAHPRGGSLRLCGPPRPPRGPSHRRTWTCRPLPTPVEPALRVGTRLALAATELALERGPLVRAEAAHAAGLGNGKPLHQLLGADLAHAGERFEQRRHLHLADDVVGLPILEHL